MEIIKALLRAPDGLFAKEMSKRLNIDIASICGDLRELEGRQWIMREYAANSYGRDVLKCRLTQLGRTKAVECLSSDKAKPPPALTLRDFLLRSEGDEILIRALRMY